MAGPPAHLAEGFGRFSPADFARYTVIARASLIESQNHLIDAVDKGYIDDHQRLELNVFADLAIQEVSGLMEYLQSTEAIRNARLAKEQRLASRQERRTRVGPRAASAPPRTTADNDTGDGRPSTKSGE